MDKKLIINVGIVIGVVFVAVVVIPAIIITTMPPAVPMPEQWQNVNITELDDGDAPFTNGIGWLVLLVCMVVISVILVWVIQDSQESEETFDPPV